MITEQCKRNYEVRIAELETERDNLIRAVADHVAVRAELRKDAERYAKLKPLLISADFNYEGEPETVLVFSWPRNVHISANLDAMLDSLGNPQ